MECLSQWYSGRAHSSKMGRSGSNRVGSMFWIFFSIGAQIRFRLSCVSSSSPIFMPMVWSIFWHVSIVLLFLSTKQYKTYTSKKRFRLTERDCCSGSSAGLNAKRMQNVTRSKPAFYCFCMRHAWISFSRRSTWYGNVTALDSLLFLKARSK